ncbi:lytic transglycosylase domain-containing protein [Salinimicrobium terrae]|uniref:lytic transglycosylase domain-containing protein n=1 Tax=Salinimicrobium terrae TaxID=470866 RepID=UPI00040EC9DC|nr:lytic transglycosylase domain-containing protein [Salinimicrobium terrae]
MKAKNIFIGGSLLVICFFGINAVQDAPSDENQEKKIINDYRVYALPMPENLEFAGEKVPVEIPDVYERMDRELLVNTYWQSNTLLLIKRANKYFPVIEPILAEYGVPDDFKYLAVIESSLTNAVSPAGARGFWQFMESTGKEYGLEINDNVDERYNLEKSTRAAAEYLKKSKEHFGSWTLAAAAYNAGNYGVDRQRERQDVRDYYDLLLGEETGRYVFRILALKEIMQNPKKYGFNFRQKDLYQHIPSYKVKVDTAVSDFAQFAQNFGINYKVLKIHNPWLREAHLNNSSRKEYLIELPEEGFYSPTP